MNISFGENLKKLRHAHELTQESLADVLGVSFQTISKWERGETLSDLTLLPDIAVFFGVSVDALLGVDRQAREEKIAEYLALFDSMRYCDMSALLRVYQTAVAEFPGDARIAVRYMELLAEMGDHVNASNYEKTSQTILSLYEQIQLHCTDDAVRIRAKRLAFTHLMKKYACTCDAHGKYFFMRTVKRKQWKFWHPCLLCRMPVRFLRLMRKMIRILGRSGILPQSKSFLICSPMP